MKSDLFACQGFTVEDAFAYLADGQLILKSTLEIIQSKRNIDSVDISKLLEVIGSCRAHSLDFLEFKRIVCPTNP